MFDSVLRRLETKSPTWVFVVLTFFLLGAFSAIYLSTYRSSTAEFSHRQQQKGEHLGSVLELAIDNAAGNMRQLAWSLASLPDVAEALLQAGRLADDPQGGQRLAEIRAEILVRLRPLQQRMEEEFGLRHLHLYLEPKNRSFLDVGRPELNETASDAGCAVVLDASRGKAAAAGFEICSDSVAMRSALPLIPAAAEGESAGYAGVVEVGISLEQTLASVATRFNVDLALVLRKERTDGKVDPEQTRRFSEIPGLEGFYIDSAEGGKRLGRVFPKPGANPPWYPELRLVPAEGETVAVTLFPIRGYGDDEVRGGESAGGITAWWDVTDELAEMEAQLRRKAVLFVALFLVLDALLYVAIRRLRDKFELVVRTQTRKQERTQRLLDHEVSGHHITRRRLAASQVELRDILDNTPAVIFVKDTRGRYLLVNKRYEKLFGIESGDIIGLTDHDAFPAKTADVFRANDLRVIEEGRALEFEEHAPQADGDHIYLSVKFPLNDGGGSPYAVCGIATDITENRRQQEALFESEERLRTLIDASPDFVLFKDGEGRWLSCNDAGRKIFSLEGVDYLEKSDVELAALAPLVYREAFLGCDRSDELAWQAAGVSRGEESIPAAGGEARIFDVIKVPLYHGDGRRKGLIVIGRDITERKQTEDILRAGHEALELQVEERQADIDVLGNSLKQGIVKLKRTEEELRESEQRFQQLADNTNDVFWMTTPNFDEVIYMSPAFERVWGFPIAELKINPKAWIEAALPEDSSCDIEKQTLHGWETSREVEYRIRRPDGSQRWISCRAFPVRDKAGVVYRIAGIAEDITRRKVAEMERLAETRKQRDILVREVHHRIKNHLQGIVGLLSAEIREKPEIAESLETAIGQIGSIALVHGLQSRNVGEEVDLYSLAHSICQAVGGVIGAEIILDKGAAPADPPILHADEAVPISLILNELLQNAIKHGQASGDGAALTLELRESGEGVLLRIVNPGGPLPEAFDLEGGQGLGTGLGLVKSLVPRNGAWLSIHGEDGRVITELELHAPTISW